MLTQARIESRLLLCINSNSDVVWKISLSEGGQTAISVSRGNTLNVWDMTTRCKLHTLKGHDSIIDDVMLNADGRLAVSVSRNTLKVWDVTLGRCIATLLIGTTRLGASLQCCAMSADGKTIVAGDGRGGVHFLELVSADEIQAPDQEEVEARSTWLSRWLKRLLRLRDR